jgi:peptidoglycan hydrolase-like protein with peptidoglycan-binding domain
VQRLRNAIRGARRIFGRGVLAAVMAFQASQSLKVDGVAGKATRKRLDAMVPPEPITEPVPATPVDLQLAS